MPDRPVTGPLTDRLTTLSEEDRESAVDRFRILQPHIEGNVPLAELARTSTVPLRTLQRWVARYRAEGLPGLARRPRCDAGRRKLPTDAIAAIESLALQKPRLSVATIYRRLVKIATVEDRPAPSYATVYAVVRALDPALLCLTHEGAAVYRDRFELVHRHRAERPNDVWQADHTQLDLLILDANGAPARPWLTMVLDDHSRVVAGYCVFLGAPSALQTALALHQAIWRKTDSDWPVCGIPGTLYVDHGSDFTSQHLEQVAAHLRIELIFSTVGRPQGRGKVERIFGTLNTELLPELPGHLVDGKPATDPRLSLSELDQEIGHFLVGTYNTRPHCEIGATPHQAWLAEGWLPAMPESLEALDLLLLTVAKSRQVRRDGIHFQGLRYMDPTLAAYVGESVTIRYDPRDIAEIRVFHQNRFLCRAVSPEHAGHTVSLKDIQQARTERRRALRDDLRARAGTATAYSPAPASNPIAHAKAKPSKPKLLLYKEDRRS